MGKSLLSYSRSNPSVAPDTNDSRGEDLKPKDRTLCTRHHLFNVHGSHSIVRAMQPVGCVRALGEAEVAQHAAGRPAGGDARGAQPYARLRWQEPWGVGRGRACPRPTAEVRRIGAEHLGGLRRCAVASVEGDLDGSRGLYSNVQFARATVTMLARATCRVATV